METVTIDPTAALAKAALTIALRGAREYMARHRLEPSSFEALESCIKANVKIHIRQALKDSREALACGMGAAAEQTFAASIVIAGIDAAKECGCPIDRPA